MNNKMRGAKIGKQRRGGCVSCAGGEETWEHMLGESMGGKKDGNWWESLRAGREERTMVEGVRGKKRKGRRGIGRGRSGRKKKDGKV